MKKTILVTGCAGFIGYHLCDRLLKKGFRVIGVDNLNDYYDVVLKSERLRLLISQGLEFEKIDISDKESLFKFCAQKPIEYIVHLAAQAGVRYSLTNPFVYGDSNLVGMLNMLELGRLLAPGLTHFLYASSSSVYGSSACPALGFEETQPCNTPLSLYAASKKSNEVMAHCYSHNFRIPLSGLRFFTVYGSWGRPDMGLMIFADAIKNNKPLELFNQGKMRRSFTHVSDIVTSIELLLDKKPTNGPPHEIYNIGGESDIELTKFLSLIGKEMGVDPSPLIVYSPLQAGDMVSTKANCSKLESLIGFKPQVPFEVGVKEAISWFKNYYGE